MPDKEDSGELMYVKCSYCGVWLDVQPGRMNQISHSICPACFRALTGDEPAQKDSSNSQVTDATNPEAGK